ncbi:EscI/YscI/HrpB family type III secretion system inner rod protein [Marinomonas balearica]|uniref:Type III secretion system major needle protein (YscF/MxiH/PrgI family) n=1 Tax=Marinomonas balearica TaxID=491947 RepID=A0A4R6M849_9GAMM|nr:EscI/YscI/HrpB family type III secretion system inner rod protein [Marinomonas balearica]TDO96329.1 type III secretion system major needle protein (YscF/MxiH/PrgI family) [Marinomonas balearica]
MSVNSTQSISSTLSHSGGSVHTSDTSSNSNEFVNQSDSNWFSSAIQPSDNKSQPENVADKIVSQLSSSSEHLQKLEDKANKALKKAGVTGDPMDVTDANRSLSSFYLESLLTTKLVSKGAQTIEKLTSLQ